MAGLQSLYSNYILYGKRKTFTQYQSKKTWEGAVITWYLHFRIVLSIQRYLNGNKVIYTSKYCPTWLCISYTKWSLYGTSTILSPVFKVPFLPAGLSSRMCLIKIPLITSPLLKRLPIPRPPTMLIPSDLLGSLQSSTL